MKIYDKVRNLLEEDSKYRNSDKELFWRILEDIHLLDHEGRLTHFDFMRGPSFESCRRCRQKIQELHPELQSSKTIKERRSKIAEERGNHIFRETTGEQKSLI